MSDISENEVPEEWEKQVKIDVVTQGARVRKIPRRQPSLKAQRPIDRDPKVFAVNLRKLAELSRKTPDEVVNWCKISKRWYSRLRSKGLARIDKRTQSNLKVMAQFFGLDHVEEFWERNLKRLRQNPGIEEQILTWSERRNWPFAQKLLELLETGDHEYLKGLIDSLHSWEASKELRALESTSISKLHTDSVATSAMQQRVGRRSKAVK